MTDDQAREIVEDSPIPDRLVNDLMIHGPGGSTPLSNFPPMEGPPDDARLTAPNGVYLGHDWKDAVHLAPAGASTRRPLPYLKMPLAANAAPIPRQSARVRDSLWAAVYAGLIMVTVFVAGYALGYRTTL